MSKKAAVAVVLRELNELEILLVKRKERPQDPWSGQVALPGGLRKKSESFLQTAIRETKEETGISLSSKEVIGSLEPTCPKNDPEMEVVPFVFFLSKDVQFKPGYEIEFCKWISLQRLMSNRVKIELSDGRRVPACTFEDLIVWGMTYRILLDLLEFLKDLKVLNLEKN